LTVAAFAGALLASSGCAPEQPAVSDKVAQYYATLEAVKPTLTAQAAPRPVETEKIPADLLTAGTRTVIFGDSWTQGAAAARPELGYAHLTAQKFGWDNQVLGGSGTGYLNPGSTNIGTFSQRIAKLPEDASVQLVIMQGSVNDQYRDLKLLPGAAKQAIQAMQAKFPQAHLVVLGPAPNVVPVDPTLLRIDNDLQSVTAAAKVTYISPVTESWITPSNFRTYINVAAASHPNNEGHAFLAGRLFAALKALAAK
jgi:lysophospholipase L1-like esterase